jgi:hypothetical protein
LFGSLGANINHGLSKISQFFSGKNIFGGSLSAFFGRRGLVGSSLGLRLDKFDSFFNCLSVFCAALAAVSVALVVLVIKCICHAAKATRAIALRA